MIIDTDEGRGTVTDILSSSNTLLEQDGECGSDSGMGSDMELSHSMDILADMDFASHRGRSNTAQRLEKLKRDRHRESNIKNIQWKQAEIEVDDPDGIFEKRQVMADSDVKNKRQSSLSVQLQQFAMTPHNPFSDYARFDGKATPNVPTRKLGIFLSMVDDAERAYPMGVIPLSSAKVSEVIGLICWQYTMQDRQPPLSDNLHLYSLYIAEDDGEVDYEFPPIDKREPISKFGFGRLALVVNDTPTTADIAKPSLTVTVNLLDHGFTKVEVDSDTIKLAEILDIVLERRRIRPEQKIRYTLERESEHGRALDLGLPLSAMDTYSFCLVRENSTRGVPVSEDIPRCMSAMAESLCSHQYKAFNVIMKSKHIFQHDVQLGISGEKVEIDPSGSNSRRPFQKHKHVTYTMERIAKCELLDTKPSGKSSFRITYLGKENRDLRHHDFESDLETTQEIVKKISNILEMRFSPFKQEHFEGNKKGKLKKRHTLPF